MASQSTSREREQRACVSRDHRQFWGGSVNGARKGSGQAGWGSGQEVGLHPATRESLYMGGRTVRSGQLPGSGAKGTYKGLRGWLLGVQESLER